jgi:hypothetical protein
MAFYGLARSSRPSWTNRIATGAAARRAAPFEVVTIEREDVTEIGLVASDDPASGVLPYVEAVVTRPAHIVSELHDAPRGILSSLAEQVVDIEGPVHIGEIVARVRAAWGLKRAGGWIHTAIEQAVDVSARTGRLTQEGDFLSIPGREAKVRDRSGVTSTTLRRCEALPPAIAGVRHDQTRARCVGRAVVRTLRQLRAGIKPQPDRSVHP